MLGRKSPDILSDSETIKAEGYKYTPTSSN
jgi:hypothetical protein